MTNTDFSGVYPNVQDTHSQLWCRNKLSLPAQLSAYLLDCGIAFLFCQNEARQHTILRCILHPRVPDGLPAECVSNTTSGSARALVQLDMHVHA
jgi:hypothetical protein